MRHSTDPVRAQTRDDACFPTPQRVVGLGFTLSSTLALAMTMTMTMVLSAALACELNPKPEAPQGQTPSTASEHSDEFDDPSRAEPDSPSSEQLELEAWRDARPTRVELDPTVQASRWFYAASALADHTTFAEAFKATAFDLKRGSLLLVTKISAGVGQPRYHYFSLDNTGWAPAPKHFVPASTVKLMASVSALWTLSKYGLDGDARLTFKDVDGRFRGSAYKLYKDALLHSSNQNYNRLMAIAGFDATNTEYLTAERGFPVMAIQSRYGKSHKAYGIRVSPPIAYEGRSPVVDAKAGTEPTAITGELPKRKGEWRTPACRGNCTTLFELQDVMRRVMLHDELPVTERFPLARVDLERIQGLLLEARNRLQPSPNRAFDEDVRVFNSVGRIPGRVLLENSFLHAPESGRRVMLALSLRFPDGHDPKKDLQLLARAALDATLPQAPIGPGLQPDAGVPIELELRRSTTDIGLLVSTPAGTADQIDLWLANERLATALSVTHDSTLWRGTDLALPEGEVIVIAIAKRDEVEVGYRSWRLTGLSSSMANQTGED